MKSILQIIIKNDDVAQMGGLMVEMFGSFVILWWCSAANWEKLLSLSNKS